MTLDVRLIMPYTQLNLSNSRLNVPFVKLAHICGIHVILSSIITPSYLSLSVAVNIESVIY